MSGSPSAPAPVQGPPIAGPVAAASGNGSGVLGAPADGDQIGAQSGAAKSDGIIAAPADPDLMTDTSCLLPFLFYGDGFNQAYRNTDFVAWNIISGNTFDGNFMLRGIYGAGFPDIQIRVVYRNASGTEQRYRDLKFAEIPSEGTTFPVTIESVGYGDYVDIYISPRKKNYAKDSPDNLSCSPSSLTNYSEAWTEAPREDFSKSLGLLARFKIFTPIKRMNTGSPTLPEVELDAKSPP